jgi:hypothetical protein
MTKTEDNNSINRRHSQVKTANRNESNSETEALVENSGGKSSESKEKSGSGGSNVTMMQTKGDRGSMEELTMTHAAGMGLTEGKTSSLAQTWPTPKESTMKSGVAGSTGANSTNVQMTNQTHPMNTKERRKKDKPSYPIFHRQASTTRTEALKN